MTAAAEWLKTLNLSLDLDADGPPLVRVTSTTAVPAAMPRLMQGDCRTLRLYFGGRTPSTNAWTPYALTTGDTITLAAKKADGTGDVLFSADTFAKGGSDEVPYYAATLDLHTTNLDAAMTGRELAVRIDIEIQTATGAVRATLQLDAVVSAEVYDGTPPSVDGAPVYYTAAQIDAKIVVPAGRRIVFDQFGGITVEALS